MQRTLAAGLFLCLAVSFAGRADVTLRYSYKIEPNPSLPPQAAEALKAQMQQMLNVGMKMQLKANRAFSTAMGVTSISDFDGEMISLIDTKQARYATVQKDEYLKALVKRQNAQMEQLPEQARKAMDRMKVDVTPAILTGRTLTIHGIESDERQITMTMAMPDVAVNPMRTVISYWTPKEADMARNPILREYHSFAQRAYQGTDPGTAAQKMFAGTPGMGSASKMMNIFKDAPVLLRMSTAIFVLNMPGMPAGATADTPFMELVMNLEEISDAAVPESVFRIPRDYTVVTIDEALSGVYAQIVPAKPAAPR